VAGALGIGVGQLINQQDGGMTGQCGIKIKLVENDATVFE
jgi:hypothetical protein